MKVATVVIAVAMCFFAPVSGVWADHSNGDCLPSEVEAIRTMNPRFSHAWGAMSFHYNPTEKVPAWSDTFELSSGHLIELRHWGDRALIVIFGGSAYKKATTRIYYHRRWAAPFTNYVYRAPNGPCRWEWVEARLWIPGHPN